MNYYISDNHFGHGNIREWYPNERPFQTVEEMNEHMISKWNSVVTSKDNVYNLGDFCFGKGTNEAYAKEIFMRLNGQKFLIKGNHESNSKRLGWVKVYDYLELNEGENHLVLFHFPIQSWQRQYHGSYHFHGHVHSTPSNPFPYLKNRLDIGVDNIGFKPKTFQELKEICDAQNPI